MKKGTRRRNTQLRRNPKGRENDDEKELEIVGTGGEIGKRRKWKERKMKKKNNSFILYSKRRQRGRSRKEILIIGFKKLKAP
jgi:hypothetical protein